MEEVMTFYQPKMLYGSQGIRAEAETCFLNYANADISSHVTHTFDD
jgi:hypothetical protein